MIDKKELSKLKNIIYEYDFYKYDFMDALCSNNSIKGTTELFNKLDNLRDKAMKIIEESEEKNIEYDEYERKRFESKIKKALDCKTSYISKSDLIKTFIEVDDYFENKPWTLKQILNRILLMETYEKEN